MPLDLKEANFDLLSVGIAVAAIGLLGFFVYFNNRKSITNRSFLLLSIITIFWGLSNYFEYKFTTIVTALWALRIHLFISVWHALAFFQLAYAFPVEKVKFPKWYKYALLPLVTITSILTLTHFVFSKIEELAPPGQVTNPERGFGLFIFTAVAFGLLIAGVLILVRKTIKVKGIERRQSLFILSGMFIMACLILLFNLILPVVFNNLTYIPYAALFVLPFIALTSYTIYRHNLFNVKVFSTALLTFCLVVFTFIEIIFSNTLWLIIFRSSIFLFALVFGINLLRGLLKEVEQRQKIEKLADDLKKANEHLKELDKMKTEFVSLATHQIRAPLAAIKGYISLIQEGDFGDVSQEIKGALDVIFNETNALVTIVADFLDVSRIEQGRMQYEFSDFELGDLAQEVIKEYMPSVEKKGLTFTYTNESKASYMIHADKGKIKQVIGNIIDNAIKYTPRGYIHLTLDKKSQDAFITISDSGVGIPKGTLPRLFQQFTRAENANETNILGTGLGLYVAKHMIESMKGKIWAESEGEGKGSRFYIQLPTIEQTSTSAPIETESTSVDQENAFKATKDTKIV